MSRWLVSELGPDVPLHFSAFHPDNRMLDVPPTPRGTLARAREIAREEGLRYVYTGNVHDTAGDTTFCPNCERALIVRDWYRLLRFDLDVTDGRGFCPQCGTAVPGHFDPVPGRFGARRIPIRIGRG